jgi:hypothetical protein
MSWLWRRLWGNGSEFEAELYGVDVDNQAIDDRETVITICLQAQIEDGKRLGFRVAPSRAVAGPASKNGHGSRAVNNTNNPLACMRDGLTSPDQRIVIRSMTRLQTYSDLGVDLAFELQHVFECDAATEVVRKRRDAAIAADANQGATAAVSRTTSVPHNGIVNNNNNAAAPVRKGIHLAQATDSEDFGDLLAEAEDGQESRDAFSGLSARQKINSLNRITLRGGEYCSNEAERENVINLGVVRSLSTVVKEERVYRASLHDETITWFAGQDNVVAEKTGAIFVGPKVAPAPAKPAVEGSVASRAATPVVSYVIMDSGSALVIFIKRFCGDMPNIYDRMRPVYTDRSDRGIRYYEVDKPLIEEAKAKILYTVYAQMYYTRLQDCIIARRVESEISEESIALKLASDWSLPIDPKTRRISDWSAEAYRPVVIITLRVLYAVVNGVHATAASLFRTRTRLVPAE